MAYQSSTVGANLHQGGPQGGAMQPSMASDSALPGLNTSLKDRGVDFLFRCNHCIKLIPEQAPIYMRHDSSYCSTACREKGVSTLYTSLVGHQLRLLTQKEHSMQSVKSDSSIHSRVSEYSSKGTEEQDNRALPWRLVAKLGKKVMEKIVPGVASHPTGDRILRTYSSGLVWGKEYTRNSSFNFVFQYFPDIDIYRAEDSHDISRQESLDMSKVSQNLGEGESGSNAQSKSAARLAADDGAVSSSSSSSSRDPLRDSPNKSNLHSANTQVSRSSPELITSEMESDPGLKPWGGAVTTGTSVSKAVTPPGAEKPEPLHKIVEDYDSTDGLNNGSVLVHGGGSTSRKNSGNITISDTQSNNKPLDNTSSTMSTISGHTIGGSIINGAGTLLGGGGA